MAESEFKFRKHGNIGAHGAEEDTEFLEHCFVDNGHLDLLLESRNIKHIVVGRTGTGKTALLQEIEKRQIDRTIPNLKIV